MTPFSPGAGVILLAPSLECRNGATFPESPERRQPITSTKACDPVSAAAACFGSDVMPKSKRRMSVKLRWLTWRARLSIPALLAAGEERKIISLIAGTNGAVAILTVCVFAWLTDLPLVFPALGPTAFILFSKPFSPDAAPRSVILGHFSGIASGMVTWHLFSHLSGEPVSLDVLGWPTFGSASLALALTCFLLVRFSCPHPPACASALIIALGGVTGWLDIFAMAIAVIVLTGQALLVNRIGGVKTPTWSAGPRGVHP